MGINQGYFGVQRAKVDPKSIISVGRLDKQKGFQDVIKALPSLPDYHYTIIGEGSDRGYLEDLAKKHQVSDRVHLVGSKTPEEIMEYYQTAGLFVLPSRTEGFGLSVVEAMAAEVPVITSDISALISHTRQGDGISIHTQDTTQLESAVKQIHKIDTKKAQEYAKQFSWESIGQKFSSLYHNTLNQ
jgi:glycogen(starch) synthase